MKYPITAACLLIALTGCQPGPKYEWGGYPSGLLAYYQTPSERADFDKVLDEAIAKGEKTHKIPPGLYAEAGYEALSEGNTQKAVELFNKEKITWPESSAFMDKAIANAGKTAPAKSSTLPTT